MSAEGAKLTLLAVLTAGTASAAAYAQPLYKYLGEDGVWVYTDRDPGPRQPHEELTLERAEQASSVRLYQARHSDGKLMLAASNTYYGPVQIAFELATTENLAPEVPTRGNVILAERSRTDLLELKRARADAPLKIEYRFQYIPGHPGSRHEPEEPYRLPYALANSHPVTQAFPNQTTHSDPSSRHAVDFEMPVGTGIYAARAGTVLEVASDYFENGLDPVRDGPRANIVRILHSDGTMSLYAHLNWNSIRVVPGQRVERGEYLADSGNTGFSTGPHLHFVVQRNHSGALESVPVEFAGIGGVPITVATGDEPVAY